MAYSLLNQCASATKALADIGMEGNMAEKDMEMKDLLVEQVVSEPSSSLGTKNPMVLSCGGIFIPRPRPMGPNDEIYKILNIANQKEPTKVVCGSVPHNLLQEVLHKESMN